MPIVNDNSYKPVFPFRNPHLNTMFPAVFRQTLRPAFVRERISTPDDDFLDVDWLRKGNKRLAILCHGLEGSSNSQYIRGMARLLYEKSWDVLAMNYRSCSGEMNRQLRMYHSGATEDLHQLVEEVEVLYDSIVLIGYSLGGNLILKYTSDGVYSLSQKIKRVVAVSVPMDLAGGAAELIKKKNIIYQQRFLKTLCDKAKRKHRQYPDQVPIADLKKVKNLRDFDEYFTGPIHGFKDAADYYKQCSSLPFIHTVPLPTLVINAQDDPFLSPSCFPMEAARQHDDLHLLMPRYGGHVGFSLPGAVYYWQEPKILDFVEYC